ncbi:MAG: formate dehydrogenase subunit alpha, partial [Actinobacteria bacterium]
MAGLAASFGSGAMTNSVADLGAADVILVVGSNTTEAHPIVGIELKRAALRGTRIIVVDPRRIRLVDHAEQWLRVAPGTNIALVNAMMRIILDEGLADDAFIAERTEGFEELRALLEDYDLEAAAETCGTPLEQIRDAALAYGSAESAAIVYCMGITQHDTGTAQVRSLANLAMLTGNIGRPGTGVNPLRGQNNVQGACDLACLPNVLPGYHPVTDAGHVARFTEYWASELELPAEAGLTVVEMMDAATDGRLHAMYVMGENPVLSDPDQAHVRDALDALDFLVVADIFFTETCEYADVVLPAAAFLEKEGTFTNTDRRIQRVRKVVDTPGEALTDLEIVTRVAGALGAGWQPYEAHEVMAEMAAITPQYGGVTYERLDAEGGLQWPCPSADHPGTPILHTESFTRGKGAFAAVDHAPAAEQPDEGMPFVLSTGRHLWNFHTNTMTGRAPGLAELNPTGYAEVSPEDAARLCVCEGEMLEITSRRGTVRAPARIVEGTRPGVVFMPFHFADAPANALTTGEHLDPAARWP